ncbi:SDR family NAD(P)-dependent oxidoreductase [Halioxenophilus aromaticivorans]|uniref:Glucose 1-dehydrogenase n=1 Tax=Halioxenophilus aromaticivorans TaxID=1306992 RepID=A0AAV3TXU4_9ALTE
MILKDKNIVVTGAARGLGLSMAQYLAELGANLVLTDIETREVSKVADDLSAQYGKEVHAFSHDVADVDSWTQIVEAVGCFWIHLDGLVNNAGIMPHVPFPETTLDLFRKTQQINVESVFIGVQAFLPLLKVAGEGGQAASVVNISSMFGQVAGPMHSAYCTSKGAVRLLTKSLAVELPKLGYNIRCNSVHPGVMDTGVSLSALQTLVDMKLFDSIEQASEHYSNVIPMGRPGCGTEIAAGVAFLLSSESSLMTGSELTLDGGYTAI